MPATNPRIGLCLLTVLALVVAALPSAAADTSLTSCSRTTSEYPQWSCIGINNGCVSEWVEVDGNREYDPNRAPDDPEMNDAGSSVCALQGLDAETSSCGASCLLDLNLPSWACSETSGSKNCVGYGGGCVYAWNDRNDNDEHERGETTHETCAGTFAHALNEV